jgi:phospholipase C
MRKATDRTVTLAPGQEKTLILRPVANYWWYDFTLSVDGAPAFTRRYAGRLETGRLGFSDPVMGGLA